MSSHRVLFLWDCDVFGGHDVTALVALRHLLAHTKWTIAVLHTNRSDRLAAQLDELCAEFSRCEQIVCHAKGSLPESLDFFGLGSRSVSIREAIQAWRPDLAVAVQGFITLGLNSLAACRRAQVPLVSFVPMTHRLRDIQPGRVYRIQDVLNRYWYHVPDHFVVISDRMKQKLVEQHRVAAEKVHVVEYGPDLDERSHLTREQAREALGLGEETRYVIGVIGRVEYRQKGHDILVETCVAHADELRDCVFLVVGDGPDLEHMMKNVVRNGLEKKFEFRPWMERACDIYPALDVLLLVSRFEGVPVVMLEAMQHRCPVIASDTDGMADVLPSRNRFPVGESPALVKVLRRVVDQSETSTLDKMEDLILQRKNTAMYGVTFAKMLQERLQALR